MGRSGRSTSSAAVQQRTIADGAAASRRGLTSRFPGRWTVLEAAAVAMALVACGTVVATLAIVAVLHVRLPFWDEWEIIPLFQHAADGSLGWAELVHQHNEHRILFPRLVFITDERFAALSGWLNLSVSLLLQATTAAILVALACRLVKDGASRLLLGGFVVLMLFTLRQEQNFTSGFQLQFFGVFTAEAAAALAYGGALGRPCGGAGAPGRALAGAALACAVASFTMANGVLAAPTLALVALLCGAPLRLQAGTWALSGLLALLFFHDYVTGTGAYPLPVALTHLMAYPRLLTAYLGNPLGDGIRTTQALGVLGLPLLAGAAWRTATGRARDPASLALLGIAGFTVATAAATTFGRIDGGTWGAFESRYATTSLIFWSSMVVYWFPVVAGGAGGAIRSRVPAVALGALMAVLAAAAVMAEAGAWVPLAQRAAALRRVSDSMMAGLYDGDAADLYEITPADWIVSMAPFLRERRDAAFADPEFAGLGRPLGEPAPPGACEGAASAVADPALGPGGVRLTGWAVDLGARRAPRRILVTDASGIVVGFGSASLPGEASRRWTAYARGEAGGVLRAYARLRDGAPCLVGQATVAPPPGGSAAR